MAETRIQGAVSVIGEHQSKKACTLIETSGLAGCLSSELGVKQCLIPSQTALGTPPSEGARNLRLGWSSIGCIHQIEDIFQYLSEKVEEFRC